MASNASVASPFHAKQVVFLFMAATVVAVVVFLCGVLVGRGVPVGGGRSGAPATLANRSIDDLPPPILSAPRSEPSAAASNGEDLSYPRRLSGDAPVQEHIGDAVTTPVASPVSLSNSSPEAEPVAEPVAEVPPPVNAAFQSPAMPDGSYVVQVSALKAPEPAVEMAESLAAKGYPTFVLDPVADDPIPYYRVRVGPFADEAEAERVLDRLQTEEGFTPFIAQ